MYVCVCVSDVGSKQELPHQRAGNCADNSYMVMTCIYVGFRLFCEGVKRIHHPPVINDPAWVLATSFGGLAINLIGIFGFRCGMYIYIYVCVCVYTCVYKHHELTHTRTDTAIVVLCSISLRRGHCTPIDIPHSTCSAHSFAHSLHVLLHISGTAVRLTIPAKHSMVQCRDLVLAPALAVSAAGWIHP